MSDNVNYNESIISGTKWQRAFRVIVDNPYNGIPTINFLEEEAINFDGKVLTNPIANVDCTFDPNNPLHAEIYIKLNELYTVLREARDSA